MCEICDNSSLLTKGLNKSKRKFKKERLPNNPHDPVEKFSCDSDKAVCMLEKCTPCKSYSIIVVEESLEDEESKDSSEYDSSCDSEDSKFEIDTTEVVLYRWQTVDKKITKSRTEVAFKDAIEMLKEKVAILKGHIHIKRRQVKKEQPDAIQSAYFGNQCFSIIRACCYFHVQGKIKNDNVIVLTERSDHDRVPSMSCLQNVVHETESKHGKCYENLHVWSDGMGAQLRSWFVFQILASTILPNKSLMWLYNKLRHEKSPMDGVRGTAKNVIFRKVKSGQVVIYSTQEFSEAVKTFAPAIHAVSLPESENIIEPKGIESSRKIKETLKIHKLEGKVNPNGNTCINFYKLPMMSNLFMYNGMEARNM